MKSVIARSLFLLLCLGLPILGAAKPQGSSIGAKEVSIPLYSSGRPEPIAVVQIHRIYKHHQRRGFFRIGVLPLWVAEEVSIKFLTYESSDRLLAQITRALTTHNPELSRSLEIRSLRITVPDQVEPRLEASRVLIAEDGSWQLLDSVIWRASSETIQCHQAVLSGRNDSPAEPRLELILPQGSRNLRLLEVSTPPRPNPSPTR